MVHGVTLSFLLLRIPVGIGTIKARTFLARQLHVMIVE
jgi:hypothetical protein